MRILFLSRWFPYPPDNGSKIRVFNVLKQLSIDHEIDLVSFRESADQVDDRTVGALREYCSDVRVVPYRHFRPSSPRALLGLLSSQPRSLADTFSAEMRAAVEDALARRGCDLLVASQIGMAPYALALKGVPALLEELELSVYRDAISASPGGIRRLRPLLTWLKLRAYVRRILPRFIACTVVSKRERENLRSVAPDYASVEIVPNAVDLERYDADFGTPVPNTLVFSGALTYSANCDAAGHFLADVYPRIRQTIPAVTLRVTGRTDGVDLGSLPRREGVEYTGYVEDIRPVIAQSWASVVPLRIGGGTRLKILESMALGTPVISTSKGAEGLDVSDGENILIADEPREFADKAVDLLRSPQLRGRLAAGGLELVAREYDWKPVGRTLRKLIERAMTATTTRTAWRYEAEVS